jgi:hypothetical protein
MIRFARRRVGVVATVILSVVFVGCSRKVPEEVKPTLERDRALARKIADDAAKTCLRAKGAAPFQPDPLSGAHLLPPNPAKGSSLEADANVFDVLVHCSWPDPRNPNQWGGTSLRALKRRDTMPLRARPEDSVESTCRDSPHDCEQVLAPSRYSASAHSADLRVVRRTSDGGEAEVVVVMVAP